MGMTILNKDFKDFLKLLNQHDVRYLLLGEYAVIYYGYVRYTGDIDIFISNQDENIKKIISVLKDFGFGVPELSKELFEKKSNIIRMGVQPNRIEILTKVSGIEFEEAYQQKTVGMIDNLEVNIISLEHLKINKKASGRHKDLDDLENLP